MTGHTSDEHLDGMQEERSTDSESATRFPTPQSGVVQDSPGNPGVGVESGGLLDEHGNYVKDDDSVVTDDTRG
ncbi:hypothetical protein SAMN04488058_103172 [Deinococcus reticulitermitis]|uniref:Uncharacterized protein n=1 Tax=Deinococcus reticulitermitis TaxID=856736 RepID=A0A1H6VHU8_9DEIO|nr:hypothetical protein [Deinococcus reticulitermitis]SEJ04133.1 hypothetical protein SAMN04488058_103172 [Deinococcus reticulitermitis]